MAKIANAAHGRDNNFNVLRMLAATSVMFSHSWPMVQGANAVEPLQRETGYHLGIVAVFVFFGVSGFFITKSFDRRGSLVEFLGARIARLYPALLVMLILTVFIIGPVFTSLPLRDFFSQPRSWTYIPANLSLRFTQGDLPGVFANNPYGNGINGSLWTLFYEVACYGMVAVVGSLGMLRPRRFAVFFTLFMAWQIYMRWGSIGEIQNNFARLSLPFAIGMACYVWKNHIPLSTILMGILIFITCIIGNASFYYFIFPITVAYGSILFGLVYIPFARKYNVLGDYSYGVYIYGFPVQQSIVCVLGAISPWLLFAIGFPLTLALAILSWTLVESPALKHRTRLLRGILPQAWKA